MSDEPTNKFDESGWILGLLKMTDKALDDDSEKEDFGEPPSPI